MSTRARARQDGDARRRAAEVRRVVLVILALNVMVAAAKAAYAWWSGSLAVATDAIHSLLDAAANVVGVVAVGAAHSPPDAEHPYGHRKIEILAAMAVGVLIAGAALQFAWSAVGDLVAGGGRVPASPQTGLAVLGGTLVTNIFVATYEARRGRELGSAFLTADAAHTASDVVVTIGVLASLGLSLAGLQWADPVAALAVTLVIGRVAWRVLITNLHVLLDAASLPVDDVREVALAVPGVAGCHRVRSRGVQGAQSVDMHLLVDGALTLSAAHQISHAVEAALRAKFPGLIDVTIHVEPEGDEEEGL